MKKFLISIAVSTLFSQILTPANAGLNAPINLENPRVVPIFGQPTDVVAPWAGWSGYLYSPRIVFSAAHSHYRFDNSGNRILEEAPLITVGKPNSKGSDKTGRVKVIKTFVGDYKRNNVVGGLNDFIVLVLEKDLVSISNGKLLTADMEKEMIATQTEISMHGYGEFQDRCAPGEAPPCKEDRSDPKKRTSDLPRSQTGVIKLVTPSYFSWMSLDQKSALANETLLSDNLSCSGDSGGPLTTLYKGESVYLGTTPLGFTPGYYCGAGSSRTADKPSGYFSPVYKHLDLIKAAEDFIKANSVTTSKSTITCIKGKLEKKVTGSNPKCPKGYKKK
jgi:hypothetical protein